MGASTSSRMRRRRTGARTHRSWRRRRGAVEDWGIEMERRGTKRKGPRSSRPQKLRFVATLCASRASSDAGSRSWGIWSTGATDWGREEERVWTEQDIDAKVVAADEPVDAVKLVRLEVGSDAEVGGGEAGELGLPVGGEDEVVSGEHAVLVGGGRHGEERRELVKKEGNGCGGIAGVTWKRRDEKARYESQRVGHGQAQPGLGPFLAKNKSNGLALQQPKKSFSLSLLTSRQPTATARRLPGTFLRPAATQIDRTPAEELTPPSHVPSRRNASRFSPSAVTVCPWTAPAAKLPGKAR
ncbi:hypothetical protein ZWY2020_045335 [Hordeum vulgare]|nr:hypothetical protein ZWY2020_045335 [Hordeum vulgare]